MSQDGWVINFDNAKYTVCMQTYRKKQAAHDWENILEH